MLQFGTIIVFVVCVLFLGTRFGHAQAIESAEYQAGLESREDLLQESLDDLGTARKFLASTETFLAVAESNLLTAEETFSVAESSDNRYALTTAWNEFNAALVQWETLKETHDRQLLKFENAENAWEKNAIWLEQYKNDYEAQFDPFAVRDRIAQCGTAFCSADGFLNDERFTVFQPHVLEMVGVHHAYAKGLTGKGVRIGIEDDIVNYRLPEFAGRISFDGAVLTYPVPYGDNYFSDSKRCERGSVLASPGCKVISYTSEYDLLETLTTRWTVANYGWPEDDERWFLRNDHEEEGSWRRWTEIPHTTGRDFHGTAVASVAAGRDFGVAPGATIIPIATDFSREGQRDQTAVSQTILRWVSGLPDAQRHAFDADFAQQIQSDHTKYDVINRSFGIGVFDQASISAVLSDDTQWWGYGLQKILPQTWRAFMQTGTHPDNRTVVVYATGNEIEEFGGLGADIPFYEPHVRGSQLAVMAVDHEGRHALYTNFCGALPSNWDAQRWGRHFCLAAPGTVNAAGNTGPGYIFHETEGTSFAAPVVTGAIALLMEHFRGQLGNTEIVKRVVNTANNQGRYVQLEIYGAGLLDLRAALQPVGTLVTGTPSRNGDAMVTGLRMPAAMGAFGHRLAASGVEVASLDDLGAPFWSTPAQFVYTTWRPSLAIPTFAEPGSKNHGSLHLGFTPGTVAGPMAVNGVQFLLGQDRIGLERAPSDGFRWGVLWDGASWQGGQASGAFGDRVRSMTTWVGRGSRIAINDEWTVRASATMALGRVFLQSGSMLDIDTHALSSWDLGVERGERGQGTWSRLSVSQPLRAESGHGTFTYLAGLKDGASYYDHATVSLAPEGREVAVAFTHETPMGLGRSVFEVAHAWDAGHEPGRTHARVGVAYQVNW